MKTLLATLFTVSFVSQVAWAKTPAKAAICATCHGKNGISAVEIYPNLKGQKKTYLIQQMKAFRDGQRKNAIMSPQAKGLSDTEIKALSEYYANMK